MSSSSAFIKIAEPTNTNCWSTRSCHASAHQLISSLYALPIRAAHGKTAAVAGRDVQTVAVVYRGSGSVQRAPVTCRGRGWCAGRRRAHGAGGVQTDDVQRAAVTCRGRRWRAEGGGVQTHGGVQRAAAEGAGGGVHTDGGVQRAAAEGTGGDGGVQKRGRSPRMILSRSLDEISEIINHQYSHSNTKSKAASIHTLSRGPSALPPRPSRRTPLSARNFYLVA
ncbi:hypothetical protein GGX14DRAFT_384781 [Mycena pura]|uniref:Uncharacterized protein n=1 Tax=Mycena pura TaxID=153505 RepID=A0AAD6YSF3_9AGAR|nr:hypothetical protein GGX14DRAFT_384781 [Mycena pura]